MQEVPRPFTRGRRRLRWQLAGYWLLFFLIIGLVLLLAVASWRRALRHSQAALLPLTVLRGRSPTVAVAIDPLAMGARLFLDRVAKPPAADGLFMNGPRPLHSGHIVTY